MVQDFMKQVVELTAAYMSTNKVTVEEVNVLLKKFTAALMDSLKDVGESVNSNPGRSPAVSIEDSVHDDYLVCLEDGKKLQMLKRHLKTVYNMTVDQYKERWGLSADYPVVAPSYAKRRSNIAKTTGLGSSGKKKSRAA
ncbi:MAG: MucR family transcriptional regulator [Alphaproteobacteria bacterium]|nr:MucR family transcriptional regulator [Alphaproteobacteria bacterium]